MSTLRDFHDINMDDTEDEEVKKNCFGKLHYTETSEEESDAECSFESNSIKVFANHRPSGKQLLKPQPIVLPRIVEQREPHVKKIIHNECEFSEDDDDKEEEYENHEDKWINGENQSDDNADYSDGESDSVEGVAQDDEESQSESIDEDSSSISTNSVKSYSEEDEFDDPLPEKHISYSQSEIPSGSKLPKTDTGDSNDDDSISADAVEDMLDKKDTSDILFSDEEEDPKTGVIDVGDHSDDNNDEIINVFAKSSHEYDSNTLNLKRTYSKQEFTQVSPEETCAEKKRNCRHTRKNIANLHALAPPFLPTLSLRQFSRTNVEDSNPSDEEEVDHQLAEELQDGMIPKGTTSDSDPVPLLTPLGTPKTFEIDGSQKIVVCEWPSNIAVDNALRAVNELRPMSPTSLERLEEESMKREEFATPTTIYENRSRSISDVSSGLTPNFGNLNVTRL